MTKNRHSPGVPTTALSIAKWALVVALIIAVFPARFGGRAHLVIVQGSSMEPTYHAGDVLFAWGGPDIEPGKIAIYRVPDGAGAGKLVVHRIESIEADGQIIMRGDNRSGRDGVDLRPQDLVAEPLINLGSSMVVAMRMLGVLAAVVAGAACAWGLWPLRSETIRSEDLVV